MKHYELVLIFGAATSLDQINQSRSILETIIPEVIAIDDIGMLPMVSPLLGHSTAYFVSYYIKSDSVGLQSIKQQIRIMREVAKHHIFVMNDSEPFVLFKDVNDDYLVLAERDAPKKSIPQKPLAEVSVISNDNESVEPTSLISDDIID